MYLYDKQRTGRCKYKGENTPKLEWKINLPHYFNTAAESSAAIDDQGNIYFGCHNGCIYSINPEGKINWHFITNAKVYSSPLILGDRIIFLCNHADVLCLNLEGEVIWKFEGFRSLKVNYAQKVINHIVSVLVYDYHQKSFNKKKINAWASPNIIGTSNKIVANLYGIGLVVLNSQDGSLLWKKNMGVPWFHLSGVAIANNQDNEYIVAVSQSNKIVFVNENGKLIWNKKLVFGYNSWSNPSIDNKNKLIYCSTSKGNKNSFVFCFDFNGQIVWRLKLKGGIRGTITISNDNFIIVPTLRGIIYKIEKFNGTIIDNFEVGTVNRGLWTSISITENNNFLFSVYKGKDEGAVVYMDSHSGNIIWDIKCGKILSTPVIDENNNLYFGTWNNDYMKYTLNYEN